jgi:acetoin utilization protein AcuB
MNITEIMTTRIVTVEMDDSLKVAKEIFDNVSFHHLLVVQREKLVGVVSDRDLLKAISPFLGSVAENDRDRSTLGRKIHQIMTRQPVTLSDLSTLQDAIEIFTENQFSCIPIVKDGDIPIGIVSWRDVLRCSQLSVPAIPEE